MTDNKAEFRDLAEYDIKNCDKLLRSNGYFNMSYTKLCEHNPSLLMYLPVLDSCQMILQLTLGGKPQNANHRWMGTALFLNL